MRNCKCKISGKTQTCFEISSLNMDAISHCINVINTPQIIFKVNRSANTQFWVVRMFFNNNRIIVSPPGNSIRIKIVQYWVSITSTNFDGQSPESHPELACPAIISKLNELSLLIEVTEPVRFDMVGKPIGSSVILKGSNVDFTEMHSIPFVDV